MRITVLGSGTAAPTARRASAGYLVEWGAHALLLDASAGTYMRALKAGLEPARLRAVVLTHFHPDHTADLPGVLWAQKRHRVATPLRICGPDGTADLLTGFREVYPPAWLEIPREVCGFPCELDGLAVRAFPADHTPEAVCLRLEADGRSVGFSGDTADCPGLREACRDADLALLECSTSVPVDGHMTPADCEAVHADTRPRRVLLTHLASDVASSLPLAEDGLVVTL